MVLSVLLLDYTLYLWHVLTHKVPVLWRFHRVHHADLDLDASTALRFHCLEMMLSVPWRAAQVLVIGVAPLILSISRRPLYWRFSFITQMSRSLCTSSAGCAFIVTPHAWDSPFHDPWEADANWSTIFAFPDYLHRTRKLNVPQQAVTIGVPDVPRSAGSHAREDYGDALWQAAPTWQLPGDGSPERGALAGTPASLAG